MISGSAGRFGRIFRRIRWVPAGCVRLFVGAMPLRAGFAAQIPAAESLSERGSAVPRCRAAASRSYSWPNHFGSFGVYLSHAAPAAAFNVIPGIAVRSSSGGRTQDHLDDLGPNHSGDRSQNCFGGRGYSGGRFPKLFRGGFPNPLGSHSRIRAANCGGRVGVAPCRVQT